MRLLSVKLAMVLVFVSHIVYAQNKPAPKEGTVKHQKQRSLHAHEHGAGKLNIALDKSALEVEIDSPAMDYLGFEYIPKTAKDKKIALDVFNKLKDVNSLVALPTNAQCTLNKMTVHEGKVFEGLVKVEDKGEDDGEDEGTEEAGHSDVGITYSLSCAKPENLKELIVTVFKNFSGVKKVELQSIFNGKQTSATLTPDNPTIRGF